MHTRHLPLRLAVLGVYRRPPLTFHVLCLQEQMHSINSNPEILHAFFGTGFLSFQDVGDLHFLSVHEIHTKPIQINSSVPLLVY